MEENSRVCVTGGSGFIGSSLVKKLLEKGYVVHATLRNLEKYILKYNKEGVGGLDVVSLDCGLVGGDTILPYTSSSVLAIVSPFTGHEQFHIALKFLQGLLCSVPLVHIDDVCEAHIFCIERPVLAGRFLCAVDCPTMKDIVDYFAEKFLDLKLIKEVEGERKRVKDCSQKLADLGFKYKFGVEETLNASVHGMRQETWRPVI